MRVRITRETIHGNPGDRRILPVGALAVAVPADNLPADSGITHWVSPCPTGAGAASGWPANTVEWAHTVGVGVTSDDFAPI